MFERRVFFPVQNLLEYPPTYSLKDQVYFKERSTDWLCGLSSFVPPPRHHVIICHLLAYPLPPPRVMTSFMNSPLPHCLGMLYWHYQLGAVHKWRHRRRGRGGVAQKMTNDDMRRGVKRWKKKPCSSFQWCFLVGGGGTNEKNHPVRLVFMYQKKEYWHSEWSQVAKGL